jgi:hypothetical protein
MRKRMRNGADPRNGSVEIKCGTERIWIKSPLFLRFRVLDLCCFFLMEYNVVVLIIHDISYTAISIKVVTGTIVKCTIWALKRSWHWQ